MFGIPVIPVNPQELRLFQRVFEIGEGQALGCPRFGVSLGPGSDGSTLSQQKGVISAVGRCGPDLRLA